MQYLKMNKTRMEVARRRKTKEEWSLEGGVGSFFTSIGMLPSRSTQSCASSSAATIACRDSWRASLCVKIFSSSTLHVNSSCQCKSACMQGRAAVHTDSDSLIHTSLCVMQRALHVLIIAMYTRTNMTQTWYTDTNTNPYIYQCIHTYTYCIRWSWWRWHQKWRNPIYRLGIYWIVTVLSLQLSYGCCCNCHVTWRFCMPRNFLCFWNSRTHSHTRAHEVTHMLTYRKDYAAGTVVALRNITYKQAN